MEWFGNLFVGVWRTTSSDSVSDGAGGSNVESPSKEEPGPSSLSKALKCEGDLKSTQTKVSSKEEAAIPSSPLPQPLSCQNDAVQVMEKSPNKEEPAIPSSPPPRPLICKYDAVQVLGKSPSKEELAPTSLPDSCTPLKISRQERRKKEREQKKRERKSEFVHNYGSHQHKANSFHGSEVCL
jgi:hypothetical protein